MYKNLNNKINLKRNTRFNYVYEKTNYLTFVY